MSGIIGDIKPEVGNHILYQVTSQLIRSPFLKEHKNIHVMCQHVLKCRKKPLSSSDAPS